MEYEWGCTIDAGNKMGSVVTYAPELSISEAQGGCSLKTATVAIVKTRDERNKTFFQAVQLTYSYLVTIVLIILQKTNTS